MKEKMKLIRIQIKEKTENKMISQNIEYKYINNKKSEDANANDKNYQNERKRRMKETGRNKRTGIAETIKVIVGGIAIAALCFGFRQTVYAEEASTEIPADSYTIIQSYQTTYDETESRAANIRQASTYLNGTILQPGEALSFSERVKRRNTENGYVVAPSFAGGRVVSSVGGGICQVSSTLYRAILQCGIIPTQRYNHSGSVYYAELGLDAAIAQGVKDLKFTNTLNYPIGIITSAEAGVLTVNIVSNQEALQGLTYLPISERVDDKTANAYLATFQGTTLLDTKFLGTSRYTTVF